MVGNATRMGEYGKNAGTLLFGRYGKIWRRLRQRLRFRYEAGNSATRYRRKPQRSGREETALVAAGLQGAIRASTSQS